MLYRSEQLALRVVEAEALRVPPSAHDIDLILVICDKLHPPVSRLAGTLSYRALLSRALSQAVPKGRALGALRFEKDGRLVFDPAHPAAAFLSPDTVRDDAVILIAAFLNVLKLLIGEVLTVRIVRQVWPEVISK